MTEAGGPLVEAVGLTKRYPGVTALDGIDFTLRRGEVHVLFGENGAGKSTLISILAGAAQPTAGDLRVNGEPVQFRSVRDARAKGISAVFQEFSLVPTLTVAENLFLGDEIGPGPLLDRRATRRRAASLLAELEFDIDPATRVSALPRAQQQMVEIAKAFRGDLAVLILDEPTASLSDRETEHLFATVARLKARGIGIVYISHRIHEFERIGDRVTVLRDGRLRGTVPARGTSEATLLEMMVGRAVDEVYPHIACAPGPPLLVVRGLVAGRAGPVSFDVRPGEVLGCAGLVGSGKSEVWRAIMGLSPVSAGAVTLRGRPITGAGTRAVVGAGVVYLPPDRKAEGLQLSASSADNILVGLLDRPDLQRPGGMLAATAARARVRAVAGDVGLDGRMLPRLVSHLSGGNQQKVLFGRGFGRDYDVYIFDEPTVGVDMGTRAQLYRLLKGLAEAGKAVVVISSDLPEVMNLSHRLLVFGGGRITAELGRADISEANVLGHFFTVDEVHA